MTVAHRWLAVLLAVLLLLAALGAALAVRTHDERADAQAPQQRYGAVLAAANAEATAFVNLRYDHAAEGIQAVAAGATGTSRSTTWRRPATSRPPSSGSSRP